ncbi:helix-turn-helix domain-containing protein [Candidatus Nitronereus thalassa]|uniref:Helix-turn-helix domain-containing protein n=1 Tax=Candidatus Nitronereus thalassa TaxID=3020898 RepID=A0ABU3K358_9BACT|nr:helix-turn-helix domain-containing protein [Candidatus Nitronereus thalassa]MDT7040828.1 helix-turn-helix domain-containing protein [Candidatus Nitronereus thalassa]
MKHTAVLKRIMEVLKVTSQRDLAATLGTTPSNISTTLKRAQIPEAWLYKVAYESQCRIEWLKTGEGPKFLDQAVAEARAAYGTHAMEGFEKLLNEWKNLDGTKRSLAQNCIEAIRLEEDPDMIQAVVSATLKRHEYDIVKGSKSPPKKRRKK